MEGLPLALDQAGVYIEETQCSLKEFHELFQRYAGPLLSERNSHADHPASVMHTFTFALERIRQRSPGAIEVLTACAFLAPDAIPEELFTEGAAVLSPVLQEEAADTFQWNRTLREDLFT